MTPISPTPATMAPEQKLWEDATRTSAGYREVDAMQLAAALKSAGPHARLRMIDVREPDEWTGQLGHIAGAELCPLGGLGGYAGQWDHAELLVMVCRSGARSGSAAATLTRHDFQRVINLRGGMIGWNQAGLPIAR